MKDIHGAEHLRAGGEARRTVSERSAAALDSLQAALRRHLVAERYREQDQSRKDARSKPTDH